MHLPNYFLADLPPEATLTAETITAACQTLKQNRARFLATRPTERLAATLAEVARSWRQPQNPFRQRALALGPAATGFGPATLAAGLDAFFGALTLEALETLLVQDLGHARRLDRLSASHPEQGTERAALARAPELLVHITGGRLPSPALASMVLGVLAGSAQFVKCASGTALIPRLFAHSLYEADPKLGACLEIAEWKGGAASLESALFAEADCVTATGNDETLAAVRGRLPGWARFLGYGHRLSFGYLTREALSGANPGLVVTRAAADVIAWNQLGCLSPHVFYVETKGRVLPEEFADLLATELAAGEQTHPRGPLPPEEAAAIASRRAFYEVRAAHSLETRLWVSPGSTAWTVVYDAEPRFQVSCLNRFVHVKAVTDLETALQGADPVRGHVSTVGVAASEDQLPELATQLARWGVSRVCPLGRMQTPPLAWRHDGRPSLGDLVAWTDWEQ